MGCDIHLHGEIKANGTWEHYSAPSLRRNYGLFAKMAGVRNYEKIDPIALPRGIPEDASVVTRLDYEHWKPDAHSESWLNAEEISVLQKCLQENMVAHGMDSWRLEEHYWGYLFQNCWGSFHEYPEERPRGVEDVRFVFWFDN